MNYIDYLLLQGEGEHLEFKFEINSTRKIAETISAFANTGGGRVLIGVKDNGKVAGVRSDEELFMLESAASLFCQPSILLSFKQHMYKGLQLVEAEVPVSKVLPVFALHSETEKTAFFRVGAANFKAPLPVVRFMQMKSSDFQYGSAEDGVLRLLKEFVLLTFNQIAQKWKSPRHQLAFSLAKLMRWGLVKIKVIEGKIFFVLAPYSPSNAKRQYDVCLSVQELIAPEEW